MASLATKKNPPEYLRSGPSTSQRRLVIGTPQLYFRIRSYFLEKAIPSSNVLYYRINLKLKFNRLVFEA